MEFIVSDAFLAAFTPLLAYWVYAGIYTMFGHCEKYRLHTLEEEAVKNLVSKSTVVKGVLLQQIPQGFISYILFKVTENVRGEAKKPSMLVIATQFLAAMVIVDTWQYFIHRYLHHNKFLYKHIHSMHHKLVVPYPFAALYNHPIEGLLVDVGGTLCYLISGMSNRTAIFFFTFATIKVVDDHCGLWLWWNPFHVLFRSNSAYHDIHHQLHGTKYNFSQVFFSIWDRILGTYMPYSVEKIDGGGFEARPMKKYAKVA